ncbi:MAG TPA: methyltransferase domain-containing protein [Planctomycetota bacterium]|nr:methyltransferase domain-containing protein [Planctomycetota bacterium]
MKIGEGVLACSVRGCGRALVLGEREARCGAGHAFDRARSGYWNLLQPQDRRSLAAGDEREAVEARARSHARGLGGALLTRLSELIAALAPVGDGTVLELGSGSGDVLARLQAACPAPAIGLDLSAAAAEHAARRFPACTWVVANADRRLPIRDASIALVASIHGRRNPAECARVLALGGHALFAVPAADDLRELREALHGEPHAESRLPALLHELAPHLEPIEHGHVGTTHTLDRRALDDLLRGTYRGQRFASRARIDEIEALEVTLASDWVLCACR